MEDGSAEAELVERDLGERVLGRVLGREADHDRARDQTEDQPAAERGPLHAVLVEVRVRGVHHELREELVLDLAHRRAARVPHALPGLEVLEPAIAGERRHRAGLRR